MVAALGVPGHRDGCCAAGIALVTESGMVARMEDRTRHLMGMMDGAGGGDGDKEQCWPPCGQQACQRQVLCCVPATTPRCQTLMVAHSPGFNFHIPEGA